MFHYLHCVLSSGNQYMKYSYQMNQIFRLIYIDISWHIDKDQIWAAGRTYLNQLTLIFRSHGPAK